MQEPRSIVVLTGAGISEPSGIPTFRDDGGVWRTHDLTDVCTLSGWVRSKAKVNAFHDEARRAIMAVEPNPAHYSLAAWEEAEEARGNAFTILTQNVDDLHERAGSNTVVHLHGEILKASCEACGMELRWVTDLTPSEGANTDCPFCGEEALRPAVTWFGEYPPHHDAMADYLATADLLVIIGTSGTIYGSEALASLVHEHGGRVVYVNRLAPEDLRDFDEVLLGSAEVEVPKLVRDSLRNRVVRSV